MILPSPPSLSPIHLTLPNPKLTSSSLSASSISQMMIMLGIMISVGGGILLGFSKPPQVRTSTPP